MMQCCHQGFEGLDPTGCAAMVEPSDHVAAQTIVHGR